MSYSSFSVWMGIVLMWGLAAGLVSRAPACILCSAVCGFMHTEACMYMLGEPCRDLVLCMVSITSVSIHANTCIYLWMKIRSMYQT
jgi:hypothetical protein